MNKISIILSSISIIAVIFLYTNTKSIKNTNTIKKETAKIPVKASVNTNNSSLKIAYVNIDSVLMNYQLSVDLNKTIENEYAKAKAKLKIKADNFQKNYAEFTDKVQRNGFISQKSAEMQQQQLAKEQQDLQSLESNLTADITRQQQEMTIQLSDSITNYLEEYNSDNRYQLIMSKSFGGVLLYADKQLNITTSVLSSLNIRYENSLKK